VTEEVAVTEEQQPVASSRRSARDWLSVAFLILALGFGIWFVAARWDRLSPVLGRINPWAVAGSFAFGAVGTLCGMRGWRSMLADLGADLPLATATRVFLVGQLGKYLPGSVWSFLAQAEMAKSREVTRKAALTGSLLGAGVLMGSGLMVASVLLPFSSPQAVHKYWWVSFVIPVFVIGLHPRVAGAVIDKALRLVRRQPLDVRPTYAGTLRAAGWYLLGWLFLGLHAWLLAVGLGAEPGRSLPVTIGGLALAVSVGLLFIPAPAGAGVRDVALVVALSPVLGSTEALAVALLSRVILAVLDFVLAGLAALWVRRLDRLGTAVP
jgi:uncharacterized membrane protein YbhN (UPF0104 family)